MDTMVVNDHKNGADVAAAIAAGNEAEARLLLTHGLTQTQAAVKALNTALALYIEQGYPDLVEAIIKVRAVAIP